MNDYVINVKFSEVNQSLSEIKKDLGAVINKIHPDEDLWDSSLIIRKWNVSERTLANWRSNGLISYVQVNNKIWYPREAREAFLNQNLIQMKHGG